MATVIRKKKWTDTRSALQRRAQDVLRDIGNMLQPAIRAAYESGGILEVETGRLARSIKQDKKGLRSKYRKRIRVGSKLQQASIHEFGGTIEAGRGYLTIPLNKQAATMRRRNKTLMGQNLITVRTKGGNLLMGRKTLKRKDFRPLFILKKSVTIPKRAVMKPAFRAQRARILMHLSKIPKITRIRGF